MPVDHERRHQAQIFFDTVFNTFNAEATFLLKYTSYLVNTVLFATLNHVFFLL